ncbi:hypothetical protein [Albirhodobacter sp. R86504]|jgi:hypothetical protein|uniref:hypothetical protein n=1 Tax=Albirhodobacter sp. R86504 TaxID=3093848 RepID=UPI00366E5886
MMKLNKKIAAILLGATVALSACSTDQVAGNTADATGFVAKTAVKGAYGAGKLAVKGASKAIGS